MAVKRSVIRCKNYEDHLVTVETDVLNYIYLFVINEQVAIANQWKQINSEWFCPYCLEKMGLETE